ncbi:pilus assembly protein TadG-related protein [Sandarakinorhabdus sp.]|uniref:pilus assembly protein TadG-related protein n=1 Tax=Sandarakinorhabdus sp. TaxID=1916663 RepID=UPI00286DCB32|nr:pilus assembly protein TadG-related protein [Sandarakinorhabdus sp.]
MSRRRSLASQRGNIALAGALMLVPLSLLAGMAIDFGRAWVAQDQLTQAVDAAALAGARQLGVRDPGPEARQFFAANMSEVDDITVESLTISPSTDNQTLTVSATGRLSTTFLALAGSEWQQLPIRAQAQTRRTTMGMEMALVLDVTGSMAGTAMTQMKLAAADLVNILYGNRAQLDTLYVSVVPYTNTVNFGPGKMDWLQGGAAATTGFAPFRWRGCVEARTGGEDQTDTPPAQAPFRPFLYPSTRAQTAARAFGGTAARPTFGDADWGATPAITSTDVPDPDDSDSMDPAQMWVPANARKGPNVGCGQPVSGLTNDRTALLRIIGLLQPSSRGGTMGNLGLQAGWMTISPRWRGLWGSSHWGTVTPAGLPLNYPGPRDFMTKVIVLMTDGDNTWFDYGRPPSFDYTGYGRLTEGRLGTTTGSTATTRINERMTALCTNIKAQGIVIYTITLGTAGATQALYRNCATSPGHYFHAPTPTQLRSSFQQIGSQLSNLRLER